MFQQDEEGDWGENQLAVLCRRSDTIINDVMVTRKKFFLVTMVI